MVKRQRCSICSAKGHKSTTCPMRSNRRDSADGRESETSASVSTFHRTCPVCRGHACQCGNSASNITEEETEETSGSRPKELGDHCPKCRQDGQKCTTCHEGSDSVPSSQMSTSSSIQRCGKCRQTGHNARRCRNVRHSASFGKQELVVSQSQEQEKKKECYYCGQEGHERRTCPARHVEGRRSPLSSSQSSSVSSIPYNCGKSGLAGHNARHSESVQEEEMSVSQSQEQAKTCFRCGQVGHECRTCPSRSEPRRSSSISSQSSSVSSRTYRCGNCGIRGHNARRCHNARHSASVPEGEMSASQSEEQSKKCFFCGEEGHEYGKCPRRNVEPRRSPSGSSQSSTGSFSRNCRNCGLRGHNIRRCPELGRVMKAGNRRSKCSKCRKLGHTWRRCPLLVASQSGDSVQDTSQENVAPIPEDVPMVEIEPSELGEETNEIENVLDGNEDVVFRRPQIEGTQEMEIEDDVEERVEAMEASEEEEEDMGAIAEERMEEDVVDGVEGEGPPICACCHRIAVPDFPVELRAIPQNYIHRMYGDCARLGPNSLVCWQCHRYLRPTRMVKWVHAWPAVLYSFLTQRRLKLNFEKFVKFLPHIVREMYANVDLSPQIRAEWNRDPLFVDITVERRNFMATLGEYRMHSTFLTLEKYPVPTILCMMGCTLFIDDEVGEKMSLLPACHYLATLRSEFSSFDADSSYFTGARADWPSQFKELDRWLVSPSIHIDRQRGLCIAMCGPSVHVDGRSQFVHVPRHPILRDKSPLVQDIIAPVVATPNIIRHGQTSEKNTSYAVLKQKGGMGLGTFTIMPRAVVEIEKSSPQLAGAQALALKNRPEIAQCYAEDVRKEHVDIEKLVSDAATIFDFSEEAVAPVVAGGTFVDIGDVMHAYKTFEHRMEGDVEDDWRPELRIEKSNHLDCLQLVHRADETGLKPFQVATFRTRRAGPRSGCVVHVTVHCIVHCRPLHRGLLREMWRARNDALHRSVNNLVKALVTGSGGAVRCQTAGRTVEERLLEQQNLPYPLPDEENCSAVVVRALRHCCGVATVSLNEGPLNVLVGQSDAPIVIVDAHDCPVGRSLEVETGNSHYLLLAVHPFFDRRGQFVVKSSFRWRENWRWYTTGDKDGPSLGRESPGRGPFEILVYATRNENMCLRKEEFINISGGQTKMRCSIHPRFYLMKEFPRNELRCCYGDCNTGIRWRCSQGHGTLGACAVGVCQTHGRQLLESPTNTLVARRPVGQRYVRKRVPGERVLVRRDETRELDEDTRGDAEAVTGAGEEELAVSSDMLVDISDFDGGLALVTKPVPSTYDANLVGVSSHFLETAVLRSFQRVSLDRKPPVVLQQMLQHLHSLTPENYLPLLYPEGALFPTIFFKSIDGAVVGALPMPSFFNHGKKKSAGGLASLEDHMQVRMRDSQSLTSRDPDYIGFSFDTVLNRTFQYNSCSAAVKKGLEHVVRPKVRWENRRPDAMSDHIDCRREVKRLGAMVREAPWTYFVTITLNESDTVGVRVIREAAEAIHPPESEAFNDLMQNLCALMSRVWDRWVKKFFDVIHKSPERPLGRVRSYWARMEFQDKGAMGNRPHVHAGVSLEPGSLMQENLNRIVNDPKKLFSPDFGTDFETLKAKGLVKDRYDFRKLALLAERLTQHNCANAKFRCQKRMADGSMACRVPRHPPSAFCSFKEAPTNKLYDHDARERLLTVGLAFRNNYGELQVEDALIGGRWQYPTEGNVISVPVVPQLFVICRSVINVQVCDRRMTTSYMCKYVSGVDEKRDVVLTVKDDAPHVLNVDAMPLYNAKITGAAKSEQRIRANAPEPLARELSLSEMTWFSLNLPYILSNVDFVDVSTEQPEYRRAVHKISRGAGRRLVALDGSLKCVNVRVGLPPWRQWSRHQVLMMRDSLESCYHADRTTTFSLRPPELRSVRRLEPYFKWFVMDFCKEFAASENLSEHPLIDGCCRRVRIRMRYLQAVREHFEGVGDEWRESAEAILEVIRPLEAEQNAERFSDEFLRFVSPEHRNECIVVFSPISPDRFDRWLGHLILTLGSFNTELEVYSCRTLLHALQHVGLIEDALNPTQEDADRLARKFVNDQLLYYSVGAREFNRLVAVCIEKLRAFMAQRLVPFESMPLATYRSIKEQAQGKLVSAETSFRNNLVDALLLQKGLPPLPNINDLRAGRPVPYDPQLTRVPNQTQESFQEQVNALNHVRAAVDSFVTPNATFVRFPLLLGPPGAGKTHVLLTGCAYALSKGLKTSVVAVTSERARVMGGEHVHLLFCIPVTQCVLETPNITANKCMLKLAHNLVRMAFLKRLDVIIFEEIGLLSLNLLVVMDIVLRRVRDNPVPFGGILMIASGDPRQLPPVDGGGIWQSAQMMTIFSVLILRHYVRSRRDLQLQCIITLIRKCVLREEEVQCVLNVIKEQQFVSSWDDVADGVLRVVSKRTAEREAVQRFLQMKATVPGLELKRYASTDTVEGVGNNWRAADSRVSRQLDYQLAESSEVALFPGAVMRVTFNNVNATRNLPRFSQGQLVVITGLPNSDVEPNQQRVEARLVPAGQRVLDVVNIPDAWPRVAFNRRSTNPVVVGGGMTKAKRLQWPLRHYVCSTIHKVLGDTVPRLATQISANDQKYALWQREQLLTVLSRVEELRAITFVGSKEDTLAAVDGLLRVNDPRAVHIEDVLKQLDVLRESPRVVLSDLPFSNPLACEVPSLDAGFVYIFVSLRLPKLFKFGNCSSIRRELHVINSSICQPNLRAGMPWVCLAYVCGFRGSGKDEINQHERQTFEADVYARVGTRVPTTRTRLAHLVKEHERWISRGHSTLVLKQCCDFVRRNDEVSDVADGLASSEAPADVLSSSDVASVPATTSRHDRVFQAANVVQPMVTAAAFQVSSVQVVSSPTTAAAVPQASSDQVHASPRRLILGQLRIPPTVAIDSRETSGVVISDVEGYSVHGADAFSPSVAGDVVRGEAERAPGVCAGTELPLLAEGLAVVDSCSSDEDCGRGYLTDASLTTTEEEELITAVKRSLDIRKQIQHFEFSHEELRARMSVGSLAGSSGACIKSPPFKRTKRDPPIGRRKSSSVADYVGEELTSMPEEFTSSKGKAPKSGTKKKTTKGILKNIRKTFQ